MINLLRKASQLNTLSAMSKPESKSPSNPGKNLPKLWLLTNRFTTIGQPLPRIVRNCAAAGVKMTIMSETDLAPWVALELAEKLADEMHGGGGRLLVSERADLAQLASADGVVITSSGFPASRLKKLFNKPSMIGLIVRAEQELARASLNDIDFVLAVNIFPSEDLNSPPQDKELDRLRSIVQSCSAPVVAAGGMTPQRAPYAIEAGARSVAMSEVAMESLSIDLLVKAFRQAMGGIE
jgi:thiamine-phosphate diphosphorylase